jgi:hypothetical protein
MTHLKSASWLCSQVLCRLKATEPADTEGLKRGSSYIYVHKIEIHISGLPGGLGVKEMGWNFALFGEVFRSLFFN